MPASVATPEMRFQVDESPQVRGGRRSPRPALSRRCQGRSDRRRPRQHADGWWLLRASNTQDVLVARAEARDQAGLDRLVAQIDEQLAKSGVERSKPRTEALRSCSAAAFARCWRPEVSLATIALSPVGTPAIASLGACLSFPARVDHDRAGAGVHVAKPVSRRAHHRIQMHPHEFTAILVPNAAACPALNGGKPRWHRRIRTRFASSRRSICNDRVFAAAADRVAAPSRPTPPSAPSGCSAIDGATRLATPVARRSSSICIYVERSAVQADSRSGPVQSSWRP